MQMVNLKLKKFKNPKDFVQIGFSRLEPRNWISSKTSESTECALKKVESFDFNF